MKSVLISIKPQWCEKIASGRKSFELRKFAPKEVPFKAYIYCTKEKKQDDIIWTGAFWNRGKWNGRIIGEFICDKTYPIKAYTSDGGDATRERRKFLLTALSGEEKRKILFETCLSEEEIFDYIGEEKFGYAWHISNLKIYDKPKELSEFYEQQKANFDVEICSECEREQAKTIHERDKEIDRLKAENARFVIKMKNALAIEKKNALAIEKKNAVKEFAERVKLETTVDNRLCVREYDIGYNDGYSEAYYSFHKIIDGLLKEYEK